jgi:hypothetical protein
MSDLVTDSDFDGLSWHDCHLWGLSIGAGDPDRGDWTSDLIIDLDFIVEWVCGVDKTFQFRVAPATLTFHGVTDLRIGVECGDSALQAAIHPMSIDRIAREQVEHQKVFLDRRYYRWRILFNWPAGGEIAFGAVGFTQRLRAAPLISPRQQLSRHQRAISSSAAHPE